MKSRSQENRSKVVCCHKHGSSSPAYGPKDDLKCLRCAKDYQAARRRIWAAREATFRVADFGAGTDEDVPTVGARHSALLDARRQNGIG